MNKLIILPLLFVISCQNYNSNSGDKVKYTPIEIDEVGNPNFAAAYNIIQNRCVNCHSSTIHNIWASYQTDQDWLDSGMILRGDPDNSYFMLRIINTGGAAGNMPLGGSALPEAEYEALNKWIEEIP